MRDVDRDSCSHSPPSSVSVVVLVLSVVASAVFVAVLAGCAGGRPAACSLRGDGVRPRLELSWEVRHPGMEADPPRPELALLIGAPAAQRIEAGSFVGTCRLLETGAQPDDPVYGAALAEIACTHAGRTSTARAALASATEIVVQRFERSVAASGEPGEVSAAREVGRAHVPECARFTAELRHGGEL